MSKIVLFRMKYFPFVVLIAAILGLGMAFAIDSDNDGMSDLYENFFKLICSDGSDAVLNNDSDELNNLAESELWTDPFSPDTDLDGWEDHVDSNALSRAVFMWGHPDFTTGDQYEYTGPQWWLSAAKAGGQWTPDAWVVASNEVAASLYISVDRETLNQDCVMDVWFEDTVDSVVQLQLLDDDKSVVVSNLVSDLTTDKAASAFKRVAIPFAAFSNATQIAVNVLQADNGFTIYSSTLYIDQDGDGLDKDQELQVGTLDTKADTDGDGVTDFTEVMVAGTDPVSVDSDNDGLSDKFELNGSLYKITTSDKPIAWDDAKRAAEIAGGHLAVITSQEEHDLMMSMVDSVQFRQHHIWIGATDQGADDVWTWVTGEPVGFDLWSEGFRNFGAEPNNRNNNESWAAYGNMFWDASYTELAWFDLYLTGATAYLIEWEFTLDPLNPDMDGDGLLDGLEIELGCNPRSIESDGDGILDYDEYHGTTHPAKADTDGDLLADNVELGLGTDPADADSDNDGLSDGQEVLHSKYELNTHCLKWEDAKLEAEIRGGRLATITNEKEHDLLFSAFDKKQMIKYCPWIGSLFNPAAGTWSWLSDEPWDFECWETEAPRNFSPVWGHGFYLYSGKWWNADHLYYKGSLIEYEQFLNPLNPDFDGDGVSDGDEALHGSSPFVSDSDGDGLNDLEEIQAGLNPAYKDSDLDMVPDSEDTDPLNPDMDDDGLLDGEELYITKTDPLSADSDNDGLLDVTVHQSVKGAGVYEFDAGSPYITMYKDGDALVHEPTVGHQSTATYLLDVSCAGMLRLALQTSWIEGRPAITHTPPISIFIDGIFVEEINAVAGGGTRPEYICYTPWLTTGRHKVKLEILSAEHDEDRSLKIDTVELHAIDGADADGDGMQDWMKKRLDDEALDRDNDGISDADEVNIYNSDPLNADTDGDGLLDGFELTYGTDILNADSDGDGVDDGVEALVLFTDPTTADFDGTVTEVAVATGAEFAASEGFVKTEDDLAKILPMRGSLEYTLVFPEQEVYRLVVDASHLWFSKDAQQSAETSALEVYIDGVFVSQQFIEAEAGVPVDVSAFLPAMSGGPHTVRLAWDNRDRRTGLAVRTVKLQSLGGPDGNGNGIKDWVDCYLKGRCTLDLKRKSFVSPLCIEGGAQYVPFMSMTANGQAVEVLQGAGERWYANLPLKQEDRVDVSASFQNGAVEKSTSIEWASYNLLKHDGETLIIRTGDHVKFTTKPNGANDGRFAINVFGETTESPNNVPVVVAFDEAGTYEVQGEYNKGNQIRNAAVTIKVVGGAFPETIPACMTGVERQWVCDNLPDDIELVSGKSLEIGKQEDGSYTLKALRTLGEHHIVARLYESGPILDSTPVDTFWVCASLDGYAWITERYDDMEVWQQKLTQKQLPASVDIHIKAIVAGVVFADDYTIERTVGLNDFNDQDEYSYKLVHLNTVDHSTCHKVELYQDGENIGQAYTSGIFLPVE